MSKKSERSKTDHISVYIDRVEDDIAVIILRAAPEIHFNLPLQYLPLDIAEGDHLKLTLELDAEATASTRQRVAALQAELETEPETNIKL